MIITYTGKKVDIFSIQKTDICIEDIAHALACINRFGAMTAIPYSVAQHSVHVMKLLDSTPYALQGLLHDASEAYLGDVTLYLKRTLVFDKYRVLEEAVQRIIFKKYDCDLTLAYEVEKADKLMMRYEANHLFPGIDLSPRCCPPTKEEIKLVMDIIGDWDYWSWKKAELIFLEEFESYPLH